MTDNFIAIDVETANQSKSSICQVGLAAYSGAALLWKWSSLVNPEEPFDRINVEIHGLRSHDVESAPTFPTILEAIRASIHDQTIASHTSFDCDALNHAAQKYGLHLPPCHWIDTCEISRLAWPNLSDHKLKTLCKSLLIELQHHNALSDALACAEVLSRALQDTGLSLKELATRVGLVSPTPYTSRSIQPKIHYSEKIELEGRPDGPLAGHVLACTGDFSIGEAQLAAIAANLGCNVEDRVSKKRTTILVVGRRDPAQFNGKEKSKKQLDAETAIAEGRNITILSEQEFLKLADQYLRR